MAKYKMTIEQLVMVLKTQEAKYLSRFQWMRLQKELKELLRLLKEKKHK